MNPKIEQVTAPVLMGESPFWDAVQQCLYYVSIFDKTLHKYDPSTGKETKTALPITIGFAVPIAGTKDEFAIAQDRKVVRIKWDGRNESKAEILAEIAEVDNEPGYNTNRINTGKADPKGRLFAGTMGKQESPGQFKMGNGSLFMFDKKGARKCAEKIHISSGLSWDVQKNKMYHIDCLEYGIRSYDYDFKTGAMSNQKMIFSFKDQNLEGVPDGMTIDTQGNLWVACFGGSSIIKVNPSSGELLQTVKIPALQVTSAAFGGKNLDELYVMSASMNINGEQKPPSGATFKITGLGVKGYPGDACVL